MNTSIYTLTRTSIHTLTHASFSSDSTNIEGLGLLVKQTGYLCVGFFCALLFLPNLIESCSFYLQLHANHSPLFWYRRTEQKSSCISHMIILYRIDKPNTTMLKGFLLAHSLSMHSQEYIVGMTRTGSNLEQWRFTRSYRHKLIAKMARLTMCDSSDDKIVAVSAGSARRQESNKEDPPCRTFGHD